ncbi:MAG: ATP-binding protein [Bacteroidota bacterium]
MKDISLHILDIAQNSVSAQAKNIVIDIREDSQKDRMSILIQDDGKGMTPEIVQQVTDPFYTTRTTRKVGMGLSLFKHNAQQTGGDLTVESKPGRGTIIKAHFVQSHIDCPPLGDMPGVMMILVGGTSGIEWYYKHTVDGKEYVFDTREVKEALDGMDINEPSVLKYLKDMIKENLQELKG